MLIVKCCLMNNLNVNLVDYQFTDIVFKWSVCLSATDSSLINNLHWGYHQMKRLTSVINHSSDKNQRVVVSANRAHDHNKQHSYVIPFLRFDVEH